MTKSIYLKDLSTIATRSQSTDFVSGSQCSLAFQHIFDRTDPDVPLSSVGKPFLEHSAHVTATRLQSSRTRIGTYRHDLLVALRLVNNIERDTIQVEYENWLVDENLKCRHMSTLINSRESNDHNATINNVMGLHDSDKLRRYNEYCSSCRKEQDSLTFLESTRT